MKAIQWIGIVFAVLAILSGCTNNRRVIENPTYVAQNTTALEINKVELNDTATVLYAEVYQPPKSKMRIDSLSSLTDNQGKEYTIRTIEGITSGQQYIMSDSGKVAFKMIFPPVASNAVSVDFSNGDVNAGAWNIYDIQLTNRPLKVSLPKYFKEAVIDKNAVLPPVEFKAGKAHLEGQILNYRRGMSEKVFVTVGSSFEYSPASIVLLADSTGKFSGDIDVFSVHPVLVYWMNNGNRCFIAPGETTSLIINPSSRKGLHSAGDNSSMGEPAYYEGYLASLSTEFNQINPDLYSRNIDSNESYLSYLQLLGTKTPETLKTFYLDEYQTKKAVLDTLNVSPACKQIMRCSLDLFYAANITWITYALDEAYIFNHQLENDQKAIDQYYATRKFNLPDDFYNVLKDFPLINSPQILYVQETSGCANQWQAKNMQPVLSKALGTDQGTLFDMMKVAGIYNDIQNFNPVSEAQIKQLPVAYQELISKKNNELLQQIEINKKKTFTENDITKVANEDVLPFILSKFRGKPILLDFWATWCGPCRMANEDLKSVKAELAKKGMVFVYVAGENSPLEVWKNMIADLHGEHFRLTAKQWDYITMTFCPEGIPTYFFIDREGNIREKQVGYDGLAPMKEKLLHLLNSNK